MHLVPIFSVQLLKHWLNCQLLVSFGRKLFHNNASLLELLSKLCLARKQHQESISFGFVTSRSSNTMNVSVSVLRAVNLDDPVDCWEVHSSRTDICAEQHSVLFLHKLEVDGGTLVLVLFAVQLEQVLTHFQRLEGLVGKADLLTTGEED